MGGKNLNPAPLQKKCFCSYNITVVTEVTPDTIILSRTVMDISKPTRRSGIVAKKVGSEIILYGNTEGAIHILNPTAKLIWDLCVGEHTPADMEQLIRTQFSVPLERDVIADIASTLKVLSEKRLLAEATA
jgi:hypothetical protein